jgi:hypothetical protein
MHSGFSISLKVELVQHTRDTNVLKKIIEFLGCGNIYISTNKSTASVVITKLSDIINIIIPLWALYNPRFKKIKFSRLLTRSFLDER